MNISWATALLSCFIFIKANDTNDLQRYSLKEGYREEFHWCIYRNFDPIPNSIFQHYAGYGCYIYGVESRFNNNRLRIVTCHLKWNNTYKQIPCGKTKSNKTVYFTKEYEFDIASTFESEIVMNKYRTCYLQAQLCCIAMSNETTSNPDRQCPMTWDGWQCWPAAAAGSTQQQMCQDHMYVDQGPSCQHFSNKVCMENGTWRTHTDLEGCDVTPRIKVRMLYHSTMLGLSICICLPAIIIFISYKKLRVMRMNLHRNLLISIVLHNSLSIVIKTEIFFDAAQHNTDPGNQSLLMINGVPCRVLAFFEKFTGQAIYTMMLLEAIYLHRQIAAAFRGPPKSLWLYLFGVLITAIPVFSWTISTAILQDHNCWIVQTDEMPLQWITDSFKILVLVINGILLMDIIRVLITKVHSIRNIASQNTRKMVRILLFLIPLFGLQFAVVSVRPNISDCSLEQAYYYFTNTVDGLQGACVALLFCYFNKEIEAAELSFEANTRVVGGLILCNFALDTTPVLRKSSEYDLHLIKIIIIFQVQILLHNSYLIFKNKLKMNKSTNSLQPNINRRTTLTTIVENNNPSLEQASLSPSFAQPKLPNDGFDNSGFTFDTEMTPPIPTTYPLDQNNISDQTRRNDEFAFNNTIFINRMSQGDPRDGPLNDPIEYISGEFVLQSPTASDTGTEATFYSNYNSSETFA